MDVVAFTALKTGRLVPITFHGTADHAFVPDLLPPTVVRNDRFWPLINDAHTKLVELDGIGRRLPDVNLLLRPLQRREALTSNSLEGTFVTPQELLLFEAREASVRGERESRREDWREVFAYDAALTQGCEWISQGRNIDRGLVRDLHRLLLTASARGREKGPGEFRGTQVVVGENRRYIPPPAEELAVLLENFEHFMSVGPVDVHPLVAAYVAHYQFEAIHPFRDGNGRIGRLILSLCIYKWLGLHTPCLYMSEFFEQNRRDYIHTLFRVSTHGDWDDWISFCLRGTIEQARSSLARCGKLEGLKRKYHELLGVRSGRAVLLVDDLFRSPIVTVKDVMRKFRVSYKPAKAYLKTLEDAGIIEQMKNQYPKTFVAREVFDAAYLE